jgi:hypothetical protein
MTANPRLTVASLLKINFRRYVEPEHILPPFRYGFNVQQVIRGNVFTHRVTAIAQAKHGLSERGIAIGSVLVKNGSLLARDTTSASKTRQGVRR